MKPPVRPLFLARQSYRARRIMDAARLLPILGLFLFLLPLLRQSGDGGEGGGLSAQLVYLFSVWLALIAAAAALARRLRGAEDAVADPDGAGGGGGAP
ncbi:hypothetical protein [Actibacterium sp. D379-3]